MLCDIGVGRLQVSQALWKEAFLSTDEQIQGEGGCTATVLLLWRRSAGEDCICLQAANVGDSGAIFVNPETATHCMVMDVFFT
jgi:Protein phosphatase 2C